MFWFVFVVFPFLIMLLIRVGFKFKIIFPFVWLMLFLLGESDWEFLLKIPRFERLPRLLQILILNESLKLFLSSCPFKLSARGLSRTEDRPFP